MDWEFTDDTPVYLQIMNQVKVRIATGILQPGEKIAPVRELAMEAGVNPNTMQKALAELEREGVLYSKRTSGRFVAENEKQTQGLQQQMAASQMENYLAAMQQLGYDSEQAVEELKEYVQKQEKG
ncbi:MAG: GntR family transcriptional regulator [Eubacteriales bacterium]|nr:GntR family transcriptional regulator [Eubacteriales bacterium]